MQCEEHRAGAGKPCQRRSPVLTSEGVAKQEGQRDDHQINARIAQQHAGDGGDAQPEDAALALRHAPAFQREEQHRHGKVGVLAHAEGEHRKKRTEGIKQEAQSHKPLRRRGTAHFGKQRAQQPCHQPGLYDAVQRHACIRTLEQQSDVSEQPHQRRLAHGVGIGPRRKPEQDFQLRNAVIAHRSREEAYKPRQPAEQKRKGEVQGLDGLWVGRNGKRV